jgi:hypothetical protein
MNLERVNLGRIILLLGGFLLYSILPWSPFTLFVECKTMLMLLVLHPRYDLKVAKLFSSVWSYGNSYVPVVKPLLSYDK